jgi:RNase H-fold protein (predicted Holliday junction resolvase)
MNKASTNIINMKRSFGEVNAEKFIEFVKDGVKYKLMHERKTTLLARDMLGFHKNCFIEKKREDFVEKNLEK